METESSRRVFFLPFSHSKIDKKNLKNTNSDNEPENNVIQIRNHVKPEKNITYDLGSPGSRFKDLYLSGNTIYIGGTTIHSDQNYLYIDTPIKCNNILTSNDGITLGHAEDSGHVYDTTNLLKSSGITLSNSHSISNSESSYQYIDTNVSFNNCYFSFQTSQYSGKFILCLTTDDSSTPTATDYYQGGDTYAFVIEPNMYGINWSIYNNSSSSATSGSVMYFNTYDVFSIGYINNKITFFINGIYKYEISGINDKTFKGRFVTNTKNSGLTTNLHFNRITDISQYLSGSYTYWTYNSSESPSKYINTSSITRFYNDGTFVTIPKKGVWNITVDYKWSTTGGYIRKKSEIRKTDKNSSSTTTICSKGSSSDYVAVNLGNKAWISDTLQTTVQCDEWDYISFYSQTGLHPTSYPLRIRAVRITAQMIHPHGEDFF